MRTLTALLLAHVGLAAGASESDTSWNPTVMLEVRFVGIVGAPDMVRLETAPETPVLKSLLEDHLATYFFLANNSVSVYLWQGAAGNFSFAGASVYLGSLTEERARSELERLKTDAVFKLRLENAIRAVPHMNIGDSFWVDSITETLMPSPPPPPPMPMPTGPPTMPTMSPVTPVTPVDPGKMALLEVKIVGIDYSGLLRMPDAMELLNTTIVYAFAVPFMLGHEMAGRTYVEVFEFWYDELREGVLHVGVFVDATHTTFTQTVFWQKVGELQSEAFLNSLKELIVENVVPMHMDGAAFTDGPLYVEYVVPMHMEQPSTTPPAVDRTARFLFSLMGMNISSIVRMNATAYALHMTVKDTFASHFMVDPTHVEVKDYLQVVGMRSFKVGVKIEMSMTGHTDSFIAERSHEAMMNEAFRMRLLDSIKALPGISAAKARDEPWHIEHIHGIGPKQPTPTHAPLTSADPVVYELAVEGVSTNGTLWLVNPVVMNASLQAIRKAFGSNLNIHTDHVEVDGPPRDLNVTVHTKMTAAQFMPMAAELERSHAFRAGLLRAIAHVPNIDKMRVGAAICVGVRMRHANRTTDRKHGGGDLTCEERPHSNKARPHEMHHASRAHGPAHEPEPKFDQVFESISHGGRFDAHEEEKGEAGKKGHRKRVHRSSWHKKHKVGIKTIVLNGPTAKSRKGTIEVDNCPYWKKLLGLEGDCLEGKHVRQAQHDRRLSALFV